MANGKKLAMVKMPAKDEADRHLVGIIRADKFGPMLELTTKQGETWFNGKKILFESQGGERFTMEMPKFGFKVFLQRDVEINAEGVNPNGSEIDEDAGEPPPRRKAAKKAPVGEDAEW